MYLKSIPSLFNPRLIKLLILGAKVLKKRHAFNWKQLRHLVFHFNIVKIGKRYEKKKKIILFSESYATLIPNFFIDRFSKEEEKFMKIVNNEFQRDCYINIKNPIEALMLFKTKRDGSKTGSAIVDAAFADYQELNLESFINRRCKYAEYKEIQYFFTDESLKIVTDYIQSLFNDLQKHL